MCLAYYGRIRLLIPILIWNASQMETLYNVELFTAWSQIEIPILTANYRNQDQNRNPDL